MRYSCRFSFITHSIYRNQETEGAQVRLTVLRAVSPGRRAVRQRGYDLRLLIFKMANNKVEEIVYNRFIKIPLGWLIVLSDRYRHFSRWYFLVIHLFKRNFSGPYVKFRKQAPGLTFSKALFEGLIFGRAYIRSEICVTKSTRLVYVSKSIGLAYSWKEIYVSNLQKVCVPLALSLSYWNSSWGRRSY